MTTEQMLSGELLPDSIKRGAFLLIGSGETHFTEFANGRELLKRIMTATSGDDPQQWTLEELESWHAEISNEDNWCHDPDIGPTTFKQEVGETDQIELVRLTDGRRAELPIIMGKRITREEVMAALWNDYENTVTLARREDPTTVGFPDMVTVLKHIEEHGLEPKTI
jgi:hypothetical protein